MNPQNPSSGLGPRAARLPGGWMAQVGPFAILAATAAYLGFRWDEIPVRFPVHWGIDGQPNGWSVRTPMGVYGPLLFGAAILIAMALSSYAVTHLGRSVRPSAVGSVAHDFAHRMSIFLLALEFFIAIIFSFVGLLPFAVNPGIMPIVIAAVVFLAALMFFTAWLAKGQVQTASRTPSSDGAASGGDSGQYWKMGMFYFNRDDAALFVEKRFGVGYTLNFARPAAWLFMAVIVLLPLTIGLIVSHQR